jgi:hypothetical protein
MFRYLRIGQPTLTGSNPTIPKSIAFTGLNHMPNTTETASGARSPRSDFIPAELTQLKHELLQAEVRLAKARAGAAGAEADVKVLGARLRAFTK